MAHLTLPLKDKMKRAGLFVVMTRWGEWEYVWLIAPLCPAGDMAARATVIDAINGSTTMVYDIACLEADYRKELNRLRHLAAQLKLVFAEQWQTAVA